MFIAKVIGNLWATRKEETLIGRKLMIVEPAKLDGTPTGEALGNGYRRAGVFGPQGRRPAGLARGRGDRGDHRYS